MNTLSSSDTIEISCAYYDESDAALLAVAVGNLVSEGIVLPAVAHQIPAPSETHYDSIVSAICHVIDHGGLDEEQGVALAREVDRLVYGEHPDELAASDYAYATERN